MTTLAELIVYIASKFQFTAENYPELEGVDKEARIRFAIRHSALHFAKTAGKIAAVSEDADHGEKINIEQLKINTAKSLINTLRLAELIGMNADDLVSAVQKNIEEINN